MSENKEITLKDMGWEQVPHGIVNQRVTDLMDMTDRVAVITGAGGPCLGQALCHRFAGLGANIVLVGRHMENIQAVAKSVEEKWGVETLCLCCDLMDFDAVGEMFEKANAWKGHIDILVNNANATRNGMIQDMTKEDIDYSIDGPYKSVAYCLHFVARYMIKQGWGKICNISSESSQRSKNVSLGIYAASKSGVNGLTRSYAGELAPYGIIVNGVAPGVMFKASLRKMFENPTPENYGPRMSMYLSVQDNIIKRVSIPEEVANTVAFLCSDANSYIAGQTIMNGGGSVV